MDSPLIESTTTPSLRLPAGRATAESGNAGGAAQGLCRRVEGVIRSYDEMRLQVYRSRPGNPNRIEFLSVGGARAMRFPAVGYFNQVYGVGEAELGRIDELRAFYAGASFKLYVSPDADRALVEEGLRSAGCVEEGHLVRLFHPLTPQPVPPWPVGMRLESLHPEDTDLFFRTYLSAFGAKTDNWEPALANMRLLARQPELKCLFAKLHGDAAGIAMLYFHDRIACLCAGAVLPWFEKLGLQSILIHERLRLGRHRGCELAVSWTEANSQSHRNLARFGFQTAYVDTIWVHGGKAQGGVS